MNLSDPNFQLELAANIAVAGSILLAGRNNVHTWWLGIVGCALFAAVFERSHLYADMVLQFFFIAISVLGWWQWLRGDHGAPLPITALRPRAWAWLAPLAVVATFGYGWMLTRLTNAYAPYLDPVRGLLDQCAGGPAPLAAPDARRGQGGRCRCLSALRAAW
jgi:nicotinamide mononucleotide transporter